MARERWPSNASYLNAILGAAIGFHNLCAPSYYMKYGIVFLIPYVLSIFLFGVPLYCLEVGLGQSRQAGHAIALTSLHPRLGGLGLACMFSIYIVCGPTSIIMGWALRSLVSSGANRTAAFNFSLAHTEFERTILQRDINTTEFYCMQDDDRHGCDAEPKGVILNFVAVFFNWTCVFFCLVFGIRAIGRIGYAMTCIPFLLLLLLLLRTLTLPGISYGFPVEFEPAVLMNRPEIWSDAASQLLFSLSLTLGVVTAYASYIDEKMNVAEVSLFVCLADSAYSVLCSFFVLSTIGYLAAIKTDPLFQCAGRLDEYHLVGNETFASCVTHFFAKDDYFRYSFLPEEDGQAFNHARYQAWFKKVDLNGNGKVDRREASGYPFSAVSLLFIIIPLALDTLQNRMWHDLLSVLIFFLCLNTLISGAGACVTMTKEMIVCFRASRIAVVSLVCLLGFIMSALFCLNVGDKLVETTLYYYRILLLLLALGNSVAVSWVHRYNETCLICGRLSVHLLIATVFVPTLVVCIARFVTWDHDDFLVWYISICLAMFAVGIVATTVTQCISGDMSLSKLDRLWELTVGNMEFLRAEFNIGADADFDRTMKAKRYQAVPFIWSIIIKFVIPPALLTLLLFAMMVRNKKGKLLLGRYDDLPPWFQAVACGVCCLALVLTVSGGIFPKSFANLHQREPPDQRFAQAKMVAEPQNVLKEERLQE